MPSKVDSLITSLQVEDYIHSIDTNYKHFKLQAIDQLKSSFPDNEDSISRELAKKYKIDKTFYKADFDNNGYTDLLVIGDHKYCEEKDVTCHYATFVVMNFGKDSIKISDLVIKMDSKPVPQIIKDSIGQPTIVVNYGDRIFEKTGIKHATVAKQLTYKFSSFIEYNSKPVDNNIDKIQFAMSGCYGTCPVFQLAINKDNSAILIAQYYNFSKDRNVTYGQEEGVFKTQLSKADASKIINLLNYIDFKNLNEGYSVMWTDDQTADLKITYANGKVKTVSDYGTSGTYGLKTLYDIFMELRFNQKWEKTTEPKGARLNKY